MIYQISTILIVVLAAVCKAISDTLDHHFDTSVFRDRPRRTWDPNQIHRSVKMIFGYPLDAWHIVNSIQICLWLTLPFVFRGFFGEPVADYILLGFAHLITFNTFYNKIFR